MRRVVWSGLALLVLLGGYCAAWWYVSERSRALIIAGIDGLPTDRVTISPGEMRRGGFPFAVRWTVAGPKVDALWALGNVSTQAGSLSLWIEIWAPSKVRFHIDQLGSAARHGPTGRAWRLGLASLSGTLETSERGTFDIQYGATDLIIDEVDFDNTSIRINHVGEALTARGAGAQSAPDKPSTHAATIQIDGIKIPASIGILGAESGRAQARLTLRGGIGDGSIEDLVAWRDASGVLEIETLDIDWAPVDLEFQATIALDEQLRLLGAGTADIRGLANLINKLVDRGDIKRSEATVTKLALALLTRPAKDGGDAVVRLPLTAQNGTLRAGPFVLGRLSPIIR